MKLNPALQNHVFLAAFGLVFLGAGILTLSTAGDTDATDELAALPVVDAASLAGRPEGTEVLVEGRVAGTGKPVEGNLVILQRQRAAGVTKPGTNEYRFAWEALSAEGTPFTVDTAAGPVTVLGSDFSWRDPPRRFPEDPGVVTAGSARSVGFAAGDPITVRATVARAGGLAAVEVFGGDRAAYIASYRASDRVSLILGGAFAAIGLSLLGYLIRAWTKVKVLILR